MRPVRILLVASHPVQYAAPLYRRYAAHPVLDVTVAYCSLKGAQPGLDRDFGIEIEWDVPLLDGYRWVHPPNWSPWQTGVGFLSLVNPGLWSIVRRGGFEVVVCYGYNAASFWIAALAAKVSGVVLVFTTDAHALAPRDGQRWKPRAKQLLLPHVFGLAEACFAPSNRTVHFLRSLGIARDRVFLTPYVVDVSFFSSLAQSVDRAAVRRRWEFSAEAPIALFCGKLVPWKRPGDLLEAGASVDGLHLVFAGEGPLRPSLEARAADLGIRERVRFLGFVNQRGLPDVYAAADVLVLPSEYEPFGLVVNEAFACGRPAIVSDACGVAGDLVRDGETGFVVPVGDVHTFAQRLRTLAVDRRSWRYMGEQARVRIAEWGPERNLEALVEACTTLARGRPE